ncbi:MAG: hypothetical protein KC593_08465 [Myxococcales bacterium]|nr:hypothetical protein [Myxococcales bacterium]MCB9625850.1 hypothetical protein [Sandaracinaceae bacterium]
MLLQSTGVELDHWPWAPGESPYQLKGLNYRGHLDWTTAHFPGGREGMCQLLAPDMAAYLSQPFLASSYYDLYPLCVAGRAMAPVMNLRFLDFVRMRSRWQAEVDVKQIYRMLLRIVSSERVAQLMPKQIQQAFNFGEAKMQVVDKGHASGTMAGMPLAIFPWWGAVVETYVTHVLEMAGAQRPHVSIRRGPDGDRRSEVPVVTVEIDVFFLSA